MAILNPEHLLAQADRLIQPPGAGPPRQVDLRRAISAAYYAAFHTALIAAADEFVGVTLRHTREYALVFRSVDHRGLKLVCEEVVKSTPKPGYAAYIPTGGFGAEIIDFADAFPNLQEQRHSADYDPLGRFRTSDAKSVIVTARAIIGRFRAASAADRKAFLFLLLFPPRR
jgi:hypothetical protein